jgi:hypothetical protein
MLPHRAVRAAHCVKVRVVGTLAFVQRLAWLLVGMAFAGCAEKPPARPGSWWTRVDPTSRDPISCDRDEDCPGPTMCGPCDERFLSPAVVAKRPECFQVVCGAMHVWCTAGHTCWQRPIAAAP